MCKNRLAPHLAAILGIVFFAFLAIGSTSSSPSVVSNPVGGETVVSSKTTSNGRVYNSKPSPEERQYDALGLVFATTTTKFDEKGREITSEEGVITMLLREAQKLGGNDIINLRTDENVVVTETKEKDGSNEKTVTRRTVTITGSALAIKYRNGSDAIVPAGSSSSGGSSSGGNSSSGRGVSGNLIPDKFTIEGNVR